MTRYIVRAEKVDPTQFDNWVEFAVDATSEDDAIAKARTIWARNYMGTFSLMGCSVEA